MKKNYVYALMSAIALVGAVSLSACSSSDDVVDVNPTFDGEAVKTQFTISFPQNVAKTRQTAGTVQQTEDLAGFRGMDNIVLYPFAATAEAKPVPLTDAYTLPINSSSLKLGDRITLSKLVKPTAADVDNTIPAYTSAGTGLTQNNNSVLFNDVTIPIGTGSFLFYGKAIDNATYTDKFYNGSLISSITNSPATAEPANITFDLDQIYPSSITPSSVGTALAAYLSQIAQANHWADCAVSTNSNQTWYNAGLGDLYTNFITLKAGSSLTVQAAVQDLYASIRNNTDDVSIAIKDAILSSNAPTNHDYTVTYAKDEDADGTLEFQSNIDNFPGDVNLPDGAALLEYTASSRTFVQITNTNDNVTSGNINNITAKYTDYVYPASLYYYCNSGIGTADASQEANYVDTKANWDAILAGYLPAKQVKSSTRSVAILDPIQYGVGRLDMTVRGLVTTTDGAKRIMYDRNGEAYDAAAGFEVTGVLIGGQKQVGFNFTPQGTAEKTIYDNITKSQSTTLIVKPRTDIDDPTSNQSGVNYTLALETAATTDIYVAVEFLNKGGDFQGADGVIPAGCKFYLVGKLSPASGTQPTNPAPATPLNQVFKQDYKTIANFSISQNTESAHDKGLGAAYNTVPDLRTPQLELGLSVDLTWQEGITFNVEF